MKKLRLSNVIDELKKEFGTINFTQKLNNNKNSLDSAIRNVIDKRLTDGTIISIDDIQNDIKCIVDNFDEIKSKYDYRKYSVLDNWTMIENYLKK